MSSKAQQLLIDHITTILVRGGLAPRQHYSNGLSVYYIDEKNGVGNHRTEYRGHIHFQGGDVFIRHPHYEFREPPLSDLADPHTKIDLADPDYYIKILKFFGVEDYKFQIFKNYHVFDDL